jgi:DNA-binding transcriptional MerR regulator
MTISEVCEKCDVSQDTLRYYENHRPLGGQAGIRV